MFIREVEKRTDLSRASIRYYESKELISPLILKNGFRKYSKQDIERLCAIKDMRELRFPVAKIKSIFENTTLAQSTLEEQRKEYSQEWKKLRKKQEIVNQIIENFTMIAAWQRQHKQSGSIKSEIQ